MALPGQLIYDVKRPACSTSALCSRTDTLLFHTDSLAEQLNSQTTLDTIEVVLAASDPPKHMILKPQD